MTRTWGEGEREKSLRETSLLRICAVGFSCGGGSKDQAQAPLSLRRGRPHSRQASSGPACWIQAPPPRRPGRPKRSSREMLVAVRNRHLKVVRTGQIYRRHETAQNALVIAVSDNGRLNLPLRLNSDVLPSSPARTLACVDDLSSCDDEGERKPDSRNCLDRFCG